MTTRKDEDIWNDSELAEFDSSDDCTRVMSKPGRELEPPLDEQGAAALEAPLDEQRAANLDALAELIKRQNEPRTLLGLGIPQKEDRDEPVEPQGDAVEPETPAAEAPEAVVDTVEPEPAAPEAVAEAVVAPVEAVEPAAEASAAPEPPGTVVDDSRAHESVLLDASQPGMVNQAPRSQSSTITPPPSADTSGPLHLNSWLETNNELVFAPATQTEPQQLVDSLRPHVSATRSEAPWSVSPERRAEPALASRLVLIGLAFAASVAATIALANALLPARKGTLLVTASGPNQLRVDEAQVLLDGKPVCMQVPCRLEALSPGIHTVNVWAKGYERMAAQPIEIRSAVDSALQLTLTRRDTAALRVDVNVPGLSVRVDGEERGTAPTTIHQLSPTEHTLRLSGNAAYAPFEQRVTLEADRTLTLEPKLVPLFGKLHLEAGSGAEGAHVEVLRDGDVREVAKLPADLELKAGAPYHVRATRRNFENFEADVSFEQGRTEQSILVTLAPHVATPATVEHKAPAPAPAAPPPATTLPAFLGGAASPAQPSASGSLNINSIPISSVLLDGKPIGSTPQKLTLSPGAHSLIFLHPTLGRQTKNVNVRAGQTTVAAVRF